MKVTQAVILDLLPVYLSGEASVDTKDLIEEFLRQHPEMASLVEAQQREYTGQQRLLEPTSAPSEDQELRTLARTRSLMERQKLSMSLALMLSAFPFSFAYGGGRFTFLLLRDQPGVAAGAWFGAAILWMLYFLTRRRVRAAGI